MQWEGAFPVVTHGQAIDIDPLDPSLLWSIDRATRTVAASRIPGRIDPKPPACGAGE